MTANTSWNILNFRSGLVQTLLDEGHDVTVLAPRDAASDALVDMGCSFVDLPMDAKGLSPFGGLALHRAYQKHFKTLGPDAVFSYTIKNNIFGALAARLQPLLFIPNITGLGTAFLSGGLLLFIAKRLFKMSFSALPLVFFQNHDDEALFLKMKLVSPDQTAVLPGSGINLERFAPQPVPDAGKGDPIRFLMISRLLRDKGIYEYVEAAGRVRKSHPEVIFQILGPLESENRSAVAPEKLKAWCDTGQIEHLGETDDVRPFIAEANCVVLPSYREGAPRSLIEAAAMSRPIITTDVPGCRRVLDSGVSGYLCSPRNGESLANACLKFISLTTAERKKMGQSGRLKMQREFDERFISEAYLRALRTFSRAA